MAFEAIIFDVDGTLAETEELHRHAFNQAFAEAGLRWHWGPALYARLLKVTGGKERITAFMRDEHGRDLQDTDRALVRDLHERKTALYSAAVADGAITLRPGIEDLIVGAHRSGVQLAIATTTSLPNVESLIDATLGAKCRSHFSVIAAGDMVPRKKPAPDIYMLAVQRLGLPANRCLALEDSRNGLLAAMSADVPTIVTTSAYTRDECFDGALAVGADLPHLLGRPAEATDPVGWLAMLVGRGAVARAEADRLPQLGSDQ